jgi:hypothetical protein
MNTHPDVMWEIVKDHQARLRAEAEHQNQIERLLRVDPAERDPFGEKLLIAGRHRHRWFGRPFARAFGRDEAPVASARELAEVSHPAGTLAPCGPGVGD